MAPKAIHDVVQPRTYQNCADVPGRDDGAADQGRRRDGRRMGRLHGEDVCRGPFVLYLHQRQRRFAFVVLPSQKRDTGQRIQLYAGCGRRVDGLEKRADNQPEPLHPVCGEERDALPDVPGRSGRPGAQGPDGLQRKSQGAAIKRDAPALRCGLHKPCAAVSDRGGERVGRGGRIPGAAHRRQRRLCGVRAGSAGAGGALQ